MPWPSAPSVTAASPVSTPARARSSGAPTSAPSADDGRDEVERRANGPLGVVLVCDRRSPDGHDGVADELLDGAAVALDDRAARCRSSARGARARPRRRGPPRSAVKPTRSAKRIETRRRSDAGAGAGEAQVWRRARVDRKRSTTLAAELLPGRVRRRARAADHLEGRSALAAELLALAVRRGRSSRRSRRHLLMAPSSLEPLEPRPRLELLEDLARLVEERRVPGQLAVLEQRDREPEGDAELAESLGRGLECSRRLIGGCSRARKRRACASRYGGRRPDGTASTITRSSSAFARRPVRARPRSPRRGPA